MRNGLAACHAFCEPHLLFPALHEALQRHVHLVRKQLINKAFLHFRDIYGAPLGEFLKLRVINVSSIYGQEISPSL